MRDKSESSTISLRGFTGTHNNDTGILTPLLWLVFPPLQALSSDRMKNIPWCYFRPSPLSDSAYLPPRFLPLCLSPEVI